MRMPVRRETVTAGPPPRLVVETAPTFPAWAARAALLLLATGFAAAALQTTGLAPSFVWGVAVGLGIVTAFLPAPPVPHLLIFVGGVVLLAEGSAPFDPAVFALLPLGQLVLRAAWWSDHVPPGARAELRALVPDLRRVVVLQAVLLVVALAVRAVALADVSSGVAAALGGLAVLGVVLLVRPRD
ncbi:hypothetical protein NSA53_19475 [Cellulosimicrobium cellulans]|uniref:hypothetical protein n=1 Tax=Cellulosimicrobium cellulans TaxID=1710 RepID=UPI00088CE28F|nr:hypothetical protein [Cellulosimicrobium cellulans]SDF51140.1 hypothetical protein SAMN04487781_1654 [Cellulosimicrobium cellulans]